MKTAISIPDATFHAAEQLASRLHVSRSELYRRAVQAYLAEHRRSGVTEAIDAALAAHPEYDPVDVAWDLAARRTLAAVEWSPRRGSGRRGR